MNRTHQATPLIKLRPLRVLVAAAAIGALLSCTPRIENRGNEIDVDHLLEIVPGTTNKSRVNALLGAPSTTSDFGEETWIYVSAQTKTVAFFKEELITRKVIYIAFDGNGVVGSIGEFSEKDGTKIEYVSRETPTAGQRITLIQQLIGNIGRFNTGQN